MPFFVETLRWNPTIDWYFFTDCGPIENCPENVRVFSTTFVSYCRRISDTLGINFSPHDPYKLCDLKPAYGFIHQEELNGIDFWAFGDIDVVMGDLRSYFTGKRLSQKDVISTHSRRISGHMCLIRNTPVSNRMFMKIKDWRKLFSMNEHQALDEGAFTRLFLKYKHLPSPIAKFLNYVGNPYFRRSEFKEAYSTPNAKIPWTDGTKNYPLKWFWSNGILRNDIDKDVTFPYLHFFVWKSRWNENEALEKVLKERTTIGAFCISEAGFTFGCD